MSLRYWILALTGVTLCAAAIVAVALGAYGLASQSVCDADADRLACELEVDTLALLLAGAIVLAIPIGSRLFAARKPGGGGIGGLALALALTAGAGAALTVGLGSGVGTPAELPALIAGGVLCAISLLLLIPAAIGTFANLDGSLTAKARALEQLRRSGLLTAEELSRRRQELLDEA